MIGLQFDASTNAYHASTKAGGCDMSVLSLVNAGEIDSKVYVVRPAVPRAIPNFDEVPTEGTAQPTRPQGEKKSGEPVEDNRTFWDKYWLYIIGAGFFLMSSLLPDPKKGRAK